MKLHALEKTAVGSVEEHWLVDSLPPFPAIALRALNLMAGSDTSLRDLCDLIRTDPAFSSGVLRLANSPLIGFPKQITSVLQASMLLGFRRLKSVVITIGLKAYLEDSYTPLLKSCWRHCLACAIVAERSAASAFLDKDFAHTAGILHDIGRVALAASMPKAYARVVEAEAREAHDLLQRERDFCGIDHCQAGLSLVEAWGLPVVFAEVASHHHDACASAKGVASLIRPSCLMADALGFPVIGYHTERSYQEILAEFSAAARHGFPSDARELASCIKKEIRVIESA